MSFQMVNFHKQRALTPESMVLWAIIGLEEDIMALNNVTKFHKILIKTIQLTRELTSLGVTDVHTDGQG